MSDLEKLEEKLKQIRTAEIEEKKQQTADRENSENMNMGLRAGMELVTSIIAGALLGWLMDRWLNTNPLFLIIFLLAGIGAGFLGVYKISQNIGTSVGIAPLHKREKQVKNAPEEKN